MMKRFHNFYLQKHLQENGPAKGARVLYLNICSFDKVPSPKTDQDPVPVSGGKMSTGTDDQGLYAAVPIVFNPSVLQEVTKDKTAENMLVNLALEYVQHQHQLTLSSKFVRCKEKMKGDYKTLVKAFQQLSKKSEPSGPVGPADVLDSPQSVLHQLSNLSTENEDKDEPVISLVSEDKPTGKSKLIEEISSTEIQLTKPDFQLTAKEAEGSKAKRLVLKIKLPLVRSVSDCELDISEDDVVLEVPGKYRLETTLPQSIDEERATAKFSVKTSSLTVTMPIKMHSNGQQS
ncbi:PIH1 domain-containing protein 2-like [Branchiostoma floridae]|uniref:PIH1 domain-containing protein 2 n=1 Tax=Branchiostoma floridae TaxID=7739 RepID=A0A9J7N4B8_BRAFL|nr:PIH1 domain-containing protein 2-like [Branchiostoma floridae]